MDEITGLCIIGAVVEVTVDSDNVLSGIYFQDAYMVENYKRFPEMLFVDATHKLNELRMPLYVLLVEDGNGESQLVSLWLVTNEDAVTIKAMAMIFKRYNKDWSRTLTIMSDKDFTERNVFLQEFPGAKLLICLYHVLRTFRREITSNKMGITAAERLHVLDILQRMSYATSEETYFNTYEELQQTKLKAVQEYFDDNWHEIRDEWVCGLKDDNLMFQNHTNNRVESINQKLKSVISKFARLPQFCRELLKILSSLHIERDHRAIILFQKIPSQPFPKGSVKYQYMQVVTPFALSYVVKQIDLAGKVKFKSNVGDIYECESTSKVKVAASSEDCNCSFRKAMHLPCKHIFAVCQKADLPLFQPTLCAERWTLEYYKSSQLILQDQNEQDVYDDDRDAFQISMLTQPKRAVLSQHEKFRKANSIAQKLATLASEVSMKEFNSRLACLEEVTKIWERGGHLSVECCDEVDANEGQKSYDIHVIYCTRQNFQEGKHSQLS